VSPVHGRATADPDIDARRAPCWRVPPFSRALLSGVALLAPLVVYVLTLARDVTVTDSGELAAAAATLGIAHPPGYPLFTLLGWAFIHLVPVETVIFRVGLVSALAAAATALFIHRLALRLLAEPEPGSAAATGALGGALLYAFSRTPWSQAVVAEVYTLQALLVVLFLLACARALKPGSDPVR
jgi:hypothetical protein